MNLRAFLIAANTLVLLAAFGSAAAQFFGLGWIGDKALADEALRAGLLVALATLHLIAVLAVQRSGKTGGLIAALIVAAPLTLALLKGWLP